MNQISYQKTSCVKGWGDGLGNKVLARQTEELILDPLSPHDKLDIVTCICDRSAGDIELGWFPVSPNQLLLMSEWVPSSMRNPTSKNNNNNNMERNRRRHLTWPSDSTHVSSCLQNQRHMHNRERREWGGRTDFKVGLLGFYFKRL